MARWAPLVAGLVAIVLTAVAAHGRATPYDNFVFLARAWLHGTAAILDWPGGRIDALLYEGRYYVIEGPFPALLLLPVVAIFGTANQTQLAILFAGVAVGCAWLTCARLGLALAPTIAVCAFLFAGTQLWHVAMLGDVWMIAHAASVAMTFVALAEVVGKRRGWLVALGAVCAAFSRFSLVLALPVYAWLVLRDRTPRERLRACAGFGAVFAFGAVLWVWYNEARWHEWYDLGYTAWYHQDGVGEPTGSPFALRYLPYQLYSFFVQGFEFSRSWPYVIPPVMGTALTFVSPALAIAFFARRPRHLVIAMWVATVLVAGPSFVYYVNGFSQFGMRHALDFEPFVVVLMALAMPAVVPIPAVVLITYSCLVGEWGVWYWNAFLRPGY